ncbi:MAG: hypothetical protein A3F43_06540 [Gammaproteobacteria bacterium RIFCSPHIGHO2_12_FULL_42_10]|nr:MAG: hypothetical protein A3F43_06540 [Gammaproteobacteria bacterium RIFCSPHIGHO2_12_FULL_42_10]
MLLLYHLGLRAGELLALRVSDFDFQKNTVLVARRHDNVNDIRTYQPVVKTIDRRIPLADLLVKTISEYVMGERRRFPAAKRHDYLFVVHQIGSFSGQPISLKGLAKVFQEIQTTEPDLFKQLRTDMPKSPIMIWRPAKNTLNNDLQSREASPGYFVPSVFDRHGLNIIGEKSLKANSHQFRHLLNTMAQRGGLSQSEIARWSGRADMKQNRIYDHMSEFELVDMLRSHDKSLSLDQPLEEIAEQIAAKIPMTRQEFNTLAMPTAHVTEFGFCIHDFTMSPCQRFRDCLNCTEQVCIKGDRRIDRIKERYRIVKELRDKAAQEINASTAGADRWYQIHDLTEKRLQELIGIMENPAIQNGAIIKLRNENEFSPLRRAIDSKTEKIPLADQNQRLLEDVKNILGGGLG